MTARSIGRRTWSPRNRRRRNSSEILPFVFALSVVSLAAVSPAKELLVDQVVASVGQSAVTLRDVRQYAWLERTLEGPSAETRTLEESRESLVRNVLIKNYLVSTGLLATVPEEDLAALDKRVRAAFGSEEETSTALKAQGLDPAGLRSLIENRIQVKFFLEKVLPSRVTLNEKEVQAYYNEKKESRFLGKPLPSVAALVRADLKREKTKKEFEKWIETERRRTEIILLPLPEEAPAFPSPSPPSASPKSR